MELVRMELDGYTESRSARTSKHPRSYAADLISFKVILIEALKRLNIATSLGAEQKQPPESDGVGNKESIGEFINAYIWQLGWHPPVALPAPVRRGVGGPQCVVGSQRKDWTMPQAAHVD
eukprot:1067851-Pyramimonas_sp.AAC.1